MFPGANEGAGGGAGVFGACRGAAESLCGVNETMKGKGREKMEGKEGFTKGLKPIYYLPVLTCSCFLKIQLPADKSTNECVCVYFYYLQAFTSYRFALLSYMLRFAFLPVYRYHVSILITSESFLHTERKREGAKSCD